MQRNDQLAGHFARVYTVFASGDPSTVSDWLSADRDVLGIGTDPDEWWVGEHLHRAFAAQVPEMNAAGMQIHAGDVQAYSEGPVGWVADQPTLRLANGTEIPMRLTSVWRQEAGAWKMVQFHLSIGVPNEVALSEELTI